MKRTLATLLLFSSLTWAADFQSAKLLEIRDASEVGANTVTDSSEGLAGAPTFVPALLERCKLTVALNGVSYSAIYPVNKHLKVTDFAAGDFVPARIEGNKLVIKTLDGKILKSKIVHREAIDAPAAGKSKAGQAK
jgi:hypothetical protein